MNNLRRIKWLPLRRAPESSDSVQMGEDRVVRSSESLCPGNGQSDR